MQVMHSKHEVAMTDGTWFEAGGIRRQRPTICISDGATLVTTVTVIVPFVALLQLPVRVEEISGETGNPARGNESKVLPKMLRLRKLRNVKLKAKYFRAVCVVALKDDCVWCAVRCHASLSVYLKRPNNKVHRAGATALDDRGNLGCAGSGATASSAAISR
jgi:hypothetical protein